jgi:site-specific DNA-methyltransferase (adenine-specific)
VPNLLLNGDCVEKLGGVLDASIHLLLSDIPYGIGAAEWDVLHTNQNSALGKASPAQLKSKAGFQRRGKPLCGWSKKDKDIPAEYHAWCLPWLKECYRVMKPGANAFIFAGRRYSHRLTVAMEAIGFYLRDILGWVKPTAQFKAQRISLVFDKRKDVHNSKKWEGWRVGNLRPVFEPIVWCAKPYKNLAVNNIANHELGAFNPTVLAKYGQRPNNLLEMGLEKGKRLHPHQKPLDLIKLLIELTTIPGQIVLDPFMGSGTVPLAAKELERAYIGIERDETYYATARQRVNHEG